MSDIVNIIITIAILAVGGIIKRITYKKIKDLDGFLGVSFKNQKDEKS